MDSVWLGLEAKSSARLAFSEKAQLGSPYQKAQVGSARQKVGSDPTLIHGLVINEKNELYNPFYSTFDATEHIPTVIFLACHVQCNQGHKAGDLLL